MEETSGKENPIKYEDLEPYTRICIETFRTLMKRELSLMKAREEHDKWITFVPDKDMKGYVHITEEIRNEYEEKISQIDRRILDKMRTWK